VTRIPAAVDFATSEAVALAEVGQGVKMVAIKFGIVNGSPVVASCLVRQGGNVARALRTVDAVPPQSHVMGMQLSPTASRQSMLMAFPPITRRLNKKEIASTSRMVDLGKCLSSMDFLLWLGLFAV
jgi:hypothetical protein